jgi:hypothetical protein
VIANEDRFAPFGARHDGSASDVGQLKFAELVHRVDDFPTGWENGD